MLWKSFVIFSLFLDLLTYTTLTYVLMDNFCMRLGKFVVCDILITLLYGNSRNGVCGVCQGISMGSESRTTPRRFTSQMTQEIVFF